MCEPMPHPISSPPPPSPVEAGAPPPAAGLGDGERAALSPQRILDAALELVDAEGLEALSMRRLGALLGVEAMSLYHHFPSKSALLDGLVTTLLRQVPLPDPGDAPWEQALLRGFTDFRRVMLAHPGAFPLVSSRPASDPESLTPIARAFGVLAGAGFSPSQVKSAWGALLSYVLGYIDCEVTGVGTAAESGAMADLIRDLDGLGFEALRASWVEAALHERTNDDEFAWGLETLLAGLRLRLAENGRQPA